MSCRARFVQCLNEKHVSVSTLREFLSPSDPQSTNNFTQSHYTPDEFNTFVTQKLLDEDVNKLSFININCRSLQHNFDALSVLMMSLRMQFSIIGVSETWLRDENSQYSLCNLDNYEFVGNNRKLGRGGGVGIFIRKDIHFKRRTDLDINGSFLESIFIEIERFSSSILICVMYRPPSQPVDNFLMSLVNVFDVVNVEKKLFHLMGDFNIYLLNVGKIQSVNDFLNILMLHSMIPLIHEPTRVTDRSSSLLDNIFTNDSCYIYSGILFTDISDHFPVYCICDTDILKSSCETDFYKRDLNENNIIMFLQLLYSTEWYLSSDVNSSYNNFVFKFTKLYNLCFPVKLVRMKYKRKNKPWITNEKY